jgi:hypothetical protein
MVVRAVVAISIASPPPHQTIQGLGYNQVALQVVERKLGSAAPQKELLRKTKRTNEFGLSYTKRSITVVINR